MKKLVCIGGGEIPRYKDGVLLPYETKEIDEEIVRLSGKGTPKLLFISIASSHPDEYFNGINKVYTVLGCIVNHLNINQSYEELRKKFMEFFDDIFCSTMYEKGKHQSKMIDNTEDCHEKKNEKVNSPPNIEGEYKAKR